MRRTLTTLCSLVGILGAMAQQPGSLDHSFNPWPQLYGNGDGANGAVHAVLVLDDGRMILGGSFTQFNGSAAPGMLMIDADGRWDTTFTTGSGPNHVVQALARQADGRILIAGAFSQYDGQVRNGIARLFPDGTLDPSFDPGAGFGGGSINTLVINNDGSIHVAGTFTHVAGVPKGRIAKLNLDGSLDQGFLPGVGFDNIVYKIAVDDQGRVIAVGNFTQFSGTWRDRIVRLTPDGILDETFNSGTTASSVVWDVSIQPDGKILLAGSFSNIGQVAKPRLARLHQNGDLDTSFPEGQGPNSGVRALIPLEDGKLLISGSFTSYGGVSIRHVARLLPNGALDTTFIPGPGSGDLGTKHCSILPNGRVVIFGTFTEWEGLQRGGIVGMFPNGGLDMGFLPYPGPDAVVNAIRVQPDGRILIGGAFNMYNSEKRPRLARLDPLGVLDDSFNTGTGPNGNVRCIALQEDGKILIGGDFTMYAGVSRKRIARLHPDGALDMSFDPGEGANDAVTVIVPQADGRIMVGGFFTAFHGIQIGRIARLNEDGSQDGSFQPALGAGAWSVEDILPLPDGKYLIAGTFWNYDGVWRADMARIHADGTLDPSFNEVQATNSSVHQLIQLPDGRIILSGSFSIYLNSTRRGVARIYPNGDLDEGFQIAPTPGPNPGSISHLALQPDGKLVMVGSFTDVSGIERRRIARFHTNGYLDSGFDPGLGADASIYGISIDAQGRFLIAGAFRSYGGTILNRLTRIHGGNAMPPVLLQVKAHLGGPYDSDAGVMNDVLREAGSIPGFEPFSSLGYIHAPEGGGEGAPAEVMLSEGDDAIVDWVVLEVRDAQAPGSVLESRSALIQRDGDVVDVDGISPVPFYLPATDYHVAIRHRNHLGCMTATPIALSTEPTTIDFSSTTTPTWGTEARENVNGTMVLWPGNANFNNNVKYVGAANDRDPILLTVGGDTPLNVVAGVYHGADHNMDGMVKYVGQDNDRDIILQTIGSPMSIRMEQIP